LAAEVFQIGSGESVALLNLSHSRERLSGVSDERAARLAIRRRRIGGGEAARRRAKPAAKRAFCNGIVKNQQGLAAEVLQIGSGERHAVLNF
jgi:hypothetical protein